ncbi:hypothetical protein [Wenjunlia tyrosinilytica]|uniref:Septum formation initiator n=1 Tax=Wenjunlia tyrosinilytica TaxID=1544741 RepID=A0A917ZG12_9ACTN|nr:hypothetical protein [Wenjunlia tyrosinilytica]GGO81802.1 hypothetical protein GCM10012280_06940 [Wenjunlia tyrosinilytica]
MTAAAGRPSGPGRPGGALGRLLPSGTTNAARTPFVLLVVVLLASGLIGLLVLNSAVNQGSFQLSRLQKETTRLTDEEQALQQEVDEFSDPAALSERATELGMVPGGTPAFLGPDGKVHGVPGADGSTPPATGTAATTPGAAQPAPSSPAAPSPAAPSPGSVPSPAAPVTPAPRGTPTPAAPVRPGSAGAGTSRSVPQHPYPAQPSQSPQGPQGTPAPGR